MNVVQAAVRWWLARGFEPSIIDGTELEVDRPDDMTEDEFDMMLGEFITYMESLRLPK